MQKRARIKRLTLKSNEVVGLFGFPSNDPDTVLQAQDSLGKWRIWITRIISRMGLIKNRMFAFA